VKGGCQRGGQVGWVHVHGGRIACRGNKRARGVSQEGLRADRAAGKHMQMGRRASCLYRGRAAHKLHRTA
jgi:hypothetical protein